MKKLYLLILMSQIALFGCSSNQAKQVEIEKREINDIHTKDDMITKTRLILEKSGLNSDQKEKLLELHGQMIIKINQMNEEFSKLKIILFKEMTNNRRNTVKINEITRQIKKIHNDKLKIMLSSLDEVDRILGDKARSIYQEDWFLEHIRP